MARIDNDKMWESIRNGLWHWPQEEWLIKCIDNALWEQGFEFKDGKIVSIEQAPFFKKDKWYMCIKDFDAWRGPYIKGELYQCPADNIIRHREGFSVENENILLDRGDENIKYSEYFRPATDEEIPHSESNQEELNEFEKTVGVFIGSWNPNEEGKKRVKAVASKLLSIARKQLQPEIDKAYKNQDEVQYRNGYNKCVEDARNAFCKTCKIGKCNSSECVYLNDFKKALIGE